MDYPDYPLTPVFCTPKDESQRKAWTLIFRQTFGNITPNRFRQNELKLEERCKKYSIEYIAPQLEDSVVAIHERRLRLQRKCKAATAKIRRNNMSQQDREKESLRQQSRNRKLKSFSGSTTPSEIRTIRITGVGGTPNYSFFPITSETYSYSWLFDEEKCQSYRSDLEQLTLGGKEQVKLTESLFIISDYDVVHVKKGKDIFMDGWPVVTCKTKDLLSAEIYINDTCTRRGASVGCLPGSGFFRIMSDSTELQLIDKEDGILEIMHQCFSRDRESICVYVVADIPKLKEKRIIQEVKSILRSKYRTGKADDAGKQIYDYLEREGISQVRFGFVGFRISTVRAGSNAYQMIQRRIMELDYEAGRSAEEPPPLSRPSPSSKALDEAESRDVYYPLMPIFCIPRDLTEKSEWEERFRDSFHVSPARFRLNENKLKERCHKSWVEYIAPQLEDSVDETLRRKHCLNEEIKGNKGRKRNRLNKPSALSPRSLREDRRVWYSQKKKHYQMRSALPESVEAEREEFLNRANGDTREAIARLANFLEMKKFKTLDQMRRALPVETTEEERTKYLKMKKWDVEKAIKEWHHVKKIEEYVLNIPAEATEEERTHYTRQMYASSGYFTRSTVGIYFSFEEWMKIKKAPLMISNSDRTLDQVHREKYWPTVRELFIWDTKTKEWIPNEKKMPKIRELYTWVAEYKQWWPKIGWEHQKNHQQNLWPSALRDYIVGYDNIYRATVCEHFTWDEETEEWIRKEKIFP